MMSLDTRRAFGWTFALAVGVYFLLYINGVSYMLTEREGDALMIFEFSGTMGFAAPLMPLLAALAYGTSFVGDIQSGYAVMITQRSGRVRYLRSKAASVMLSGGLAVSGGLLLFLLLINLRFPQDTSEALVIEGASDLMDILSAPGAPPLALYYLCRLLLQFFAGAFWAMSALAFSAFYPNVPLSLCAPLVLYRLASAVGSLGFVPAHLNLIWLADGQVDLGPAQTMLAGVLVFGILTLLLALVFGWRAGRRLRYA